MSGDAVKLVTLERPDTIQEFIFLYIRKLFECLYDHLSDLQIEKMMKQMTQITVSDLCHTIVI